MRKGLACSCGDRRFKLRLQRDEQVGLLTCTGGHHSLLLDSRDYWYDVIQTARPREVRCACGGRVFDVDLEYEFLAERLSVRGVGVGLRCVVCGSQRVGATFEIDYEPTETLLSQPLDPCPTPWLKARQTEISAFWLPGDVREVVSFLAGQVGARCYAAIGRLPPRRLAPEDVSAAVAKPTHFEGFFSLSAIEFPDELRDCWKRLPVVHLPSPIHMRYSTGEGSLYFLHWAEEIIVDGRIVRQEAKLLDMTRRLRSWLAERFSSERGARTFDNRGEYERLKGGW